MKTYLYIFLGTLPLLSYGGIETKTEQKDGGKRGQGKTTTITRDGSTIYKLFEQDQNRDGVVDNYIESFMLGGRTIFQITLIGGKRGMLSRRELDAQIILSSRTEDWRADEILIEDSSGFEVFTIQESGYYRPVDDQTKARLSEVNAATEELTDGMKESDLPKIRSAVEKLESMKKNKE